MLAPGSIARLYHLFHSILPNTDYNSNYYLGCYYSDHYIQMQRPVKVVVLESQAEKNNLYSALKELTY